ncbi:MAG: cytochrome P450 [Streptosporangiaceae bacterium]
MSEAGQAVAFAGRLYWQRVATTYTGHLRRDPMALLNLRQGRADPYPIYERIRAGGTLVTTRGGNWVTASHRVCDAVLRNRRFGVYVEEGIEMSFLGMNPPDHTRLRRFALPAFSPKAVAGYRDRIERTVGELLDRAAASGEFDLVSALAAPLPIAVITDLLGVPDADVAAFAQYGAVIGGALDGIKSLRHAGQLQANGVKLQALFENLFELRRREPADDIISRMVAAEGDQVQPAEMLPMCVLLLVAGFETTVNLIGNCVLALLGHREQWQDLCADPQNLAAKAVEETLRFDPPVQLNDRVALEPFDLDGHAIRPGQRVTTLIGGANRDPEVYPEPGTFDIHREAAAEHLAFSSGIHYCPGQPLARLEATIALRMLAERMPGLTLAGPVQRRNTTTIRGPLHLPVIVAQTTVTRLHVGKPG